MYEQIHPHNSSMKAHKYLLVLVMLWGQKSVQPIMLQGLVSYMGTKLGPTAIKV